MNNRNFIWYSFFTTGIGIFFFFLFAQSTNLSVNSSDIQIIGTKAGYFLASMLLTLLIYRAVLSTLKIKVSKLAHWHSLKEKAEDFEFIRLIELLVGVLSVSITVSICAINLAMSTTNVLSQYLSLKDLALNGLASLLAAGAAYYYPRVLEKEYFVLTKGRKIS